MPEENVEIADPGKMHLMGHFLRAVLQGRLDAGARAPRGRVAVRAGGMELTLTGDGRRVRLDVGILPDARAVVCGSLDTLLGLALGHAIAPALAAGRLRIRGNPFALLPWLPLLRLRKTP